MSTQATTAKPYRILISSDDPDWLQARQDGIGASEVASIMGDNPWCSPLEVYARKIGRPAGNPVGEAAEWGHRLEPVIRRAFEEKTGRETKPAGVLLQSKQHGWALSTLDFWTRGKAWNSPPLAGPWHPLEIKNTARHMAEHWVDGVPRYNRWQGYHQMFVTGAARVSFAVLMGGNAFAWADLERDERVVQHMIETCAEFWQRVEARDPPPTDDSASCSRALAALFPSETPEAGIVTLSGELIELDAERQHLKSNAKRDGTRIREIDNLIKAEIGEAAEGVALNGVRYTWKSQARKGHTVEPSTSRVLRRHEPKESP